MVEIWRSVAGFGDYEVSNQGRVRSWRGNQGRGKATTPRILKWSRCGEYGAVTLCREDQQKRRYVHHLVAEAFVGPRPEGHEVRHLNGDREDCRASNLAYGTSAQNKQDTARLGRAWYQQPDVIARRTIAWRASMQKRSAA